jgi:DNA-binding LytR/AlgR family response regulator
MNSQIRCLIVDDEPVAREILERHLAAIEEIEVIASCKNAVEAFTKISEYHIDLIFLDINMPGISGLSFAKSIHKGIKIIFTTAYREYAVDGFDLQAVDYLLKPISLDRLIQAIHKYMNEQIQFTSTNTSIVTPVKQDHLFVRSDRKMIKVDFHEITYIESLSDYVKIHLGSKTLVTRETISNLEAKLPKDDFIRVHRSYLVAIDQILSYTNEIIEVQGKDIPLSRSYKSDVLDRLQKYC